MTAPIVRLVIAGTELPIETHHLACTIEEGQTDTGRRTLSVSAQGWYPPTLTGVDWTAPVSIGWRDLQSSTAAWRTLTCWSQGPVITSDLDAVTAAWTLSGTETAGLSSLLTIGGVSLPRDTHHLGCTVETGWNGSGQRTLRIQASGWHAPALSAVDWSAPVTVSWLDRRSGATTWRALTVDSRGPQITDDLGTLGASWSLEGTARTSEAATAGGRVTINGTAYIASISVSPIGGVIQRKSNGAGVLMRAWGKHSVRISGRGTAPSITPGAVTVVSAAWSGTILCTGLAADLDQETQALTWSVTGESQ